MEKVNFGVIGLKGIGRTHIDAIKEVDEADLVAVADIDEDVGRDVSSQHKVEWYADYVEMLERQDIDAVTICTPHFLHAPMAIKAMEYGKDVLVEKPMAVSVVEADQMIDRAEREGVKLGVVYQYRLNPIQLEIKSIIEGGKIGRILRVCMEACVFRTQAYYNRDTWRGKWATEGGGAMINQTIHYFDLLQWFVGKPRRLHGWVDTMLHEIEVEDIASSAILFENGAHGIVQVSTVDAVPTLRFEIAGERGKLVSEGSGLRLGLLEKSAKEYVLEDVVWGKPSFQWLDVDAKEKEGGGHAEIIRDFARSILEDRNPMITGEDGRASLEIVNAIILSSFEGRPVEFPISRDSYGKLLKRLKQR
ncbi:MAG: Gfo/Idh/MocA family protein [Candidatus Bathyarchaeia archaeon]